MMKGTFSNRLKGTLVSVLLMLFFVSTSRSQYAFTNFPLPNIFSLEDVWHFSVSGPQSGDYDRFYVSVRVFDGSGQLMLQSNCTPFSFNGGNFYVNKLNVSQVEPLQTQFYGNSNLQSLVSNGGLFPAGHYNFQFLLLGRKTSTGVYETLGENFSNVVVDLLFPPTLLTPFDNDSIEEFYPVFTWAPAFSGSGERIFYEIILVEELPGQSAEQALNANPYYYQQDHLSTSSLPYPVSAQKLRANQWYAWRVTAKVNGQPMARSESWRFIITEPKPDSCKPKPAEFYYEMRAHVGANFAVIEDGQLNFMLTESYETKIDKLEFEILDNTFRVVADHKSLFKPYSAGFNKYMMLLCDEGINVPKGYHILKIKDSKGKYWYLPFDNRTEINPCDPPENHQRD